MSDDHHHHHRHTLVAVLQKRGRFWTAEPHFPPPRAAGDGRRGGARRRIVLASNRVEGPEGGTAGAGELVLVRLGRGRGENGTASGGDHESRGRSGARRGKAAGGDISARGARILRRIGRPDVARDAIEAMLLERGLAREFAPPVLDDARRARAAGDARARQEVREGRRLDLRELATLTIDPASAQDFDDAISAQTLPDGSLRVWVHIADVALYVQEGSAVDLEARLRGTSIYVPGSVEPMLPHELSNEACSLMPGAERAALSVELDFRGAEIVRSAFHRSLIRSDVRLNYEQVDRIFAGRSRAQDPWAAPLAAVRTVAVQLGRSRERAGGLVVDSGEPEILFDRAGHVREIRTRAQTESHRLIEHLMIAANEAVAQRLAQVGLPCLYRVHQRPEPARVARLIEQLASLGVPTPALPETMSSTQAAAAIAEVSQRVERHVQRALSRAPRAGGAGPTGAAVVRGAAAEVSAAAGVSAAADAPAATGERTGARAARAAGPSGRAGPWGGRVALTSLVLRSLRQAYYSPKNVGHAGLHSECYCHFTSPIRRYPDLVCHRALVSTLGGQQAPPPASELGDLGAWTSERERAAMEIERAGDDLARCYALEQELYQEGWEHEYLGEVTGLISAGAFVAFGGIGAGADGAPSGPLYEGMLPVRRLRAGESRDWWELNELETVLHGERSGTTIRLGDPIAVRIARVDTVRGRVDLAPIE